MSLNQRKPIRLVERIGTLTAGHSFKFFEGLAIDKFLYPGVIASMGPLDGGLIMLAFTFVENLFLIWVYDQTKRDWFGFEALKKSIARQEEKERKWLVRFVRGTKFFFLTFASDSFFTTLSLRKGIETYDGLKARDWLIYVSSTILSNLSWLLVISGLLEVFRWLMPSEFLPWFTAPSTWLGLS